MENHDHRLGKLKSWLAGVLKTTDFTIEPASEDASFRRYFRVRSNNGSRVVMDAPPEHEDCEPFINIAQLLASHELNVPQVHEQDLSQGFLLLGDLGNTPYLDKLNSQSADSLYADALNALLIMQTKVPHAQLPDYNMELLNAEMSLFTDWFLKKHLNLQLDSQAENTIADTFKQLIGSALEQPRAFVHRDYHSRNLMMTDNHNPGILDFQDALSGPITYDLVSLLKDCYVSWPHEQVRSWTTNYYTRLRDHKLAGNDPHQFERWFDWMGMQRHMKAIGIFARLNHRDNKPGYLKDIPRTLTYLLDVSARYPEHAGFNRLMQKLAIQDRLTI